MGASRSLLALVSVVASAATFAAEATHTSLAPAASTTSRVRDIDMLATLPRFQSLTEAKRHVKDLLKDINVAMGLPRDAPADWLKTFRRGDTLSQGQVDRLLKIIDRTFADRPQEKAFLALFLSAYGEQRSSLTAKKVWDEKAKAFVSVKNCSDLRTFDSRKACLEDAFGRKVMASEMSDLLKLAQDDINVAPNKQNGHAGDRIFSAVTSNPGSLTWKADRSVTRDMIEAFAQIVETPDKGIGRTHLEINAERALLAYMDLTNGRPVAKTYDKATSDAAWPVSHASTPHPREETVVAAPTTPTHASLEVNAAPIVRPAAPHTVAPTQTNVPAARPTVTPAARPAPVATTTAPSISTAPAVRPRTPAPVQAPVVTNTSNTMPPRAPEHATAQPVAAPTVAPPIHTPQLPHVEEPDSVATEEHAGGDEAAQHVAGDDENHAANALTFASMKNEPETSWIYRRSGARYLATDETPEEATARFAQRIDAAQDKVKDALSPALYKKLQNQCLHPTVKARVKTKSGWKIKYTRPYDLSDGERATVLNALRNSLGKTPEAELGGYSELDFYTMLRTSYTEAGDLAIRLSAKERKVHPVTRLDYVAEHVQVMRSLQNRQNMNWVGADDILSIASQQNGKQYNPWKPAGAAGKMGCIVTGTHSTIGSYSTEAFTALVNPRTMYLSSGAGDDIGTEMKARSRQAFPVEKSNSFGVNSVFFATPARVNALGVGGGRASAPYIVFVNTRETASAQDAVKFTQKSLPGTLAKGKGRVGIHIAVNRSR